jgi:hypothetical protein
MNYITTNSFWTFKLWIVNSQSDVTSNPKRRHNRQQTNKKKHQDANASQNKKSCKPTHKPIQIAAHFILPNRTKAHPPPKINSSKNIDIRIVGTKTIFKFVKI